MLTVNKDIPSHEENLFTSLMYRFLPYWPLFAVLQVITILGAWGFLRFFSIPTYEVSAALLIKDERKGVNDPRMLDQIDAFSTSKLVDNEMSVLRSRGLMNKVVDTLMLYAPIFEEGKLKSTPAYSTSPIRIKLKSPEKLIESPRIYFSFNSPRNTVKIDSVEYPLNKWVKTPYGTMQIIRNRNQQDQRDEQSTTKQFYFTIIPPKVITSELIANLSVEPPSKLSTILSITLQDPVPQRGEDILNNLIFMYNQVAINDKNKLAANTLAFIENRIKLIETDLKTVETEVQHFKSSQGAVDLSEQGKMFLQNVGDNDRKIADINLQLAVLKKVEEYVISKNNKDGIVPSTMGINDPVLSQLLQKLYDSEIQYQKLKSTTAENNPLLLAIADEIEKRRPSILESIRNLRSALQASRANLASTNNVYNAALQNLPQKERKLLEISRQQAIKNSAYSFLLQKREETALSNAPTAGNSSIVDMAESSLEPVSPKPIAVYLIATIIALGSGIGLITSKELLTNKLLFRSDIEENTDIPIVIELSNANREKLATFTEPTEVFVIEQFRQMRATMGLFGRSFNKKKILITSSIAGEGKSYVSTNLAYSLASSGKKVILIDFDLRNPHTSQLFDCFKQTGIIEYLTEDINPEHIIKNTAYYNLSIAPAGTNIGDHTELLLNGKLESFFTYLEKEYDYIIVDTPPIELVSDAYLLTEYCDTTLFVMRHNYTPKTKIKRLNQNSKLKSMDKLSIVFTGVKPRGFIKGDGYGYGYGYETRYGRKSLKIQKS